jgi:nucleoside-diphosphate-sugar epimerase
MRESLRQRLAFQRELLRPRMQSKTLALDRVQGALRTHTRARASFKSARDNSALRKGLFNFFGVGAPPKRPHCTAEAAVCAGTAVPRNLALKMPSRKPRILLTGSTGCIGGHIVEELLTHTDCNLELLVRGGMSRFTSDTATAFLPLIESGRVRVHDVDLADSQYLENEELQRVIGTCDALILCATSWGGETAQTVNVASVLAMVRAVNKSRCRQIIYFSTASVMAPGGDLLIQEATHWGTDYIRSKAMALQELLQEMKRMDEAVPLTVLFPTLVLGPRSHIGKVLDSVDGAEQGGRPLYRGVKYALRFLCMEPTVRAHFIHAADCAQVVRFVLFGTMPASSTSPVQNSWISSPASRMLPAEHSTQIRFLVVGQQPPFSYEDAVRALCRLYGLRVPARWLQLPVDPLLWLMVHRLVPVDSWTRFCLRRRHQLFIFPQAVRPEDFHGVSVAPDLYTALARSSRQLCESQMTMEPCRST